MKFYWHENNMIMQVRIGSNVRGMTYHNQRPDTVSFEPVELMNYLKDMGPDKLHEYLHRCKMALRREITLTAMDEL